MKLTDHFSFHGLAAGTIRFRWLMLLIVLLLSAFFIYRMQGLQFDNSHEIWFVEGDRSLELLNKFKATFANEDYVYLLFEEKTAFTPDTIRLIDRLANDLETNVPYVRDMTWLGNVEYIESAAGGVDIRDYLETIPETSAEITAILQKALQEPAYINSLISEDGKVLGLILEMDRYPEDRVDPKLEVALAVKKILEKESYRELSPYLVGGPILHHDYDKLTARETRLFLLICLGIQMVVLMWVGRGVGGVLVPLVVVTLGIFWTFGLIGVIGYVLNLFVILVPILLICVGIGDSMHVITEFHNCRDQGMKRKEAMIEAVTMVGIPCLLTSLTTATAFLAFLVARIKPYREMGVYAALGVVAVFLLTLILVPVFYSLGKDKAKARVSDNPGHPRDIFDRFLQWIQRIIVGYPKAVISVFAGFFILSVIGFQYVETESNTIKMLSPKLTLRQIYDYVDARMGGTMSMEFMLDTGRKDGVKDATFLKQMDAFQEFLDRHPLTTKTTCVLNTIKKMRRALHEDKPEYYAVPDTNEAVSQYLFLYETSGGDQLDKMVSFDYEIARLTAKMRILDTKDVRQFTADVMNFAEQTFSPEIKVELTGRLDWVRVMNDLVGEGQMHSFTMALVVITLMMIAMLRSVKLGLFSMVPNVFPVFITLGAMGFSGIYMDLPLMSLSAIILGVAVDDTIHFFTRYRREFDRLGNYALALKATLRSVGRAILFTSMTLTLGFSVLMFSDLSGLARFGLLAGFAFTWALLADLLLAPAIFITFKPLGPEKESL
jgi:hydrophobe/amphiphile efflux-3 (HAE3) family protein